MARIWLEWLAYYLIAVNFVAFAAFGLDKSFAERGRRRISEKRLIGWAVIGGTPGAYAGRHFFRHKTRKASFSEQLHGVAMMQVLLLIGGYIYFQID
jgi:uncharacterized membrane protein YsdA (DUF1294 family)